MPMPSVRSVLRVRHATTPATSAAATRGVQTLVAKPLVPLIQVLS